MRHSHTKLTPSPSVWALSQQDSGGTNGTDTTDNAPSAAPSSEPHKGTSTPVIVGVVVGVAGGLLLLGGALWLWCRRRKPTRSSGESAGPRSPTFLRSPVRRLVVEEDAGEVFEYLPPQYREDWQHGLDPSAESTPSAHSASPLVNPGATRGAPTSATLVAEAAVAVPPLKRAYRRAFDRMRGVVSGDASRPAPLSEEYKRAMQQRALEEKPVPAPTGAGVNPDSKSD